MFEESKSEGLIISKSRTKSAARNCNVSGEFYEALDKKVRDLISQAERRAMANSRKTIKPQDL
jgi:histone H3/H4